VTDPFAPLARALESRRVRYVLIGVSGANYYAPEAGARFVTEDYDLFVPLDAHNLVAAWTACDDVAADLWLSNEPLDRPHDLWLAERVVERKAVTRATGREGLQVDFTLVMQGYEFDAVWKEHRLFLTEGIPVPTARLLHIVTSKHATGRDKDKLFLATHRAALEQLLKQRDDPL
jgi:hypothetical protein